MIDARGFSCPLPVLMVKKEIESKKPEHLTVMVDNVCSVENLTRFALSCGYDIRSQEEGEDFKLEMTKK